MVRKAMPTPLRLLILEDNPFDAELTLHELRRAGYDPVSHRVDTETEFQQHLEPTLELILADFTMPQFDSLRALEIMQERQLDIPFIIVSGTIGEERAVQVMQCGATDYIIKDRLARLGPAVKQSLANRKLKQQKLKAEQTVSQLAAIVETSADAILAQDLDGNITSWNRAAEGLYGYFAGEALGKNVASMMPTNRRATDPSDDLEEQIKRLRNGEHISPFETVRVRKDGVRIEVLLSISPLLDSNGVLIGLSAIALDITQRKRSERFLATEQVVNGILAGSQTLEESSPRLLQTIVECMRWEVGILWIIDTKANILRQVHCWHCPRAIEPFVQALLQQPVQGPGTGVAGRTWSTNSPVWQSGVITQRRDPDSQEITQEWLHDVFALPMHLGSEVLGVIEFYNHKLRMPDKLLLGTLEKIASQLGQFCERRHAEAALRASEEQFRQLADAMPQIVWTAGTDGRVNYFNERAYSFAECSSRDNPEETWQSIVHRDDRQRVQDVWAQSIRSGAPFEVETRLNERSTGQHRWFLLRAVHGNDNSGVFTRWYGTGTDIDDQKKGVDELRVSEERFRNLIMALPEAVYTTDPTGRITLLNEHAVQLWGRRPKLGKEFWCGSLKMYLPDGTPLALDDSPLARSLREGQAVLGQELLIERPDGSKAWVMPHPKLIRGPLGEIIGAVNVLIDLTQRKQLEEQFRQSHKMEAVGQLAAGVAHDFNNFLTVIIGYSELLLNKFPNEEAIREPLRQIRKAGDGAATLTRQLLAFGRKQIFTPVVLDLNVTVREIEKMLGRLIGENIKLTIDLQPDIGFVKVDAGQMEQVMMNLLVNARDAMPKGGCATIATRNVVLSGMQLQTQHALPSTPYTLLTVADNGIGMNKETQLHIFEPFYTTKQTGKGTGLGLSTVFGIVKQSGGFIEVESAIGSGTSFRIYLPQTRAAMTKKRPTDDIESKSHEEETILLVEDEDGLRAMVETIVENNGYKVLSAKNGSEAARICYEYPEIIHLLLTDVVLPGINGRELGALLLPSRPNMKVLYMSGYTDDILLRHGILEEETSFLAKPFTPHSLLTKLRETLNKADDQVASVLATSEIG